MRITLALLFLGCLPAIALSAPADKKLRDQWAICEVHRNTQPSPTSKSAFHPDFASICDKVFEDWKKTDDFLAIDAMEQQRQADLKRLQELSK